jgi:hypothetical protein
MAFFSSPFKATAGLDRIGSSDAFRWKFACFHVTLISENVRAVMPSEIVGMYEIEYSGVLLPEGRDWAAHAAIFKPSANPMHRDIVFHDQRVCVESVFPSKEAAENEARNAALAMLH